MTMLVLAFIILIEVGLIIIFRRKYQSPLTKKRKEHDWDVRGLEYYFLLMASLSTFSWFCGGGYILNCVSPFFLGLALGVELLVQLNHRVNERDYALAQKLHQELAAVRQPEALSLYNDLGQNLGTWKPFRVDRHPDLTFSGKFEGYWGAMFFHVTGISGVNHADLKSMAILVFFINESGQTLRVLIPSERVIQDILVKMVWGIFNQIKSESHVGEVVDEFLRQNQLGLAIANSETMVDRLDAACQNSYGDRPDVRISGVPMAEGEAFCHRLIVGDRTAVFYPAGYFAEISKAARDVLAQ